MLLWTYTEVTGKVFAIRLGSGQHPGLPQGLYLIWWGLRVQRDAHKTSLPPYSVEGHLGHAETCKGFLTEESRANPAMSQGFRPQLMQLPQSPPWAGCKSQQGPLSSLPWEGGSHSHPAYCTCVECDFSRLARGQLPTQTLLH